MFVALFSHVLLKMNFASSVKTWRATLSQVKGAAIALICGVAMVQLMLKTGNANLGLESMVREIARAFLGLPQVLYVFLSPWIGVLGAFMAGSNTVSNILFSPLQYEAAILYGLKPELILALQNVGGAVGNMICISNVVAALTVTGLVGNKGLKGRGMEGAIIKINFVPVIFYCTVVSLATFFLIAM